MPDLSQLDRSTTLLVALVAAILMVALSTSAAAAVTRRRKEQASLSAIDFVRSSFASQLARGVPMDELLLQMVEALRDGFKLETAELWLCTGGSLRLVAAEPRAREERWVDSMRQRPQLFDCRPDIHLELVHQRPGTFGIALRELLEKAHFY